jgi:hypothetical protein
LAGVKYLPWQILNRRPALAPLAEAEGKTDPRPVLVHFLSALKAFVLVPIFPLLGYYLLDQTGISKSLVGAGMIHPAILGEGFGHVGLCFSLHYVLDGFRGLIKGIRCLLGQ